MSSDTYNVYLGVSDGLPRDHHAIWVNTGGKKVLPNGQSVDSGEIIQVVGNIQQGMTFQVKNVGPEESNAGKEKTKLGTVKKDEVEKLKQICSELPPPSKQFNGRKRIDPSKDLYRCQEWTKEAIQRLRDAGVLETVTP